MNHETTARPAFSREAAARPSSATPPRPIGEEFGVKRAKFVQSPHLQVTCVQLCSLCVKTHGLSPFEAENPHHPSRILSALATQPHVLQQTNKPLLFGWPQHAKVI